VSRDGARQTLEGCRAQSWCIDCSCRPRRLPACSHRPRDELESKYCRRPWIDHRCLGVPRVKPPAPQAFPERSWTFLIEGRCRAAWYLRIVASHCSAGLCFIDPPFMPSSLRRIVRYVDISVVALQARDEGFPVESTMARMRVSDDSGRK
jgi:hypothetical protein